MIASLKKWFKELRPSVSEIQTKVEVPENDTVSRFLLSKNHFARSKNIVKYGAFLPNHDGETSVYRTTGLTEATIWQIGEKFVRIPISKSRHSCTLYGRGDIKAKEVVVANLDLVPKPIPHPRHADISNWPVSKKERQMLATILANKATLHLTSD